MSHMLPRPCPLWARLMFLFLTVTLSSFFCRVVVQAAEPQPADRAGKVSLRLAGSRAAGAYFAEPWQAGGPKILDTRRPSPPAEKLKRPPPPDSPPGPDLSPPTFSVPVIAGDRYWLGARVWKFYRPFRFHPRPLHRFGPLVDKRFRKGLTIGRGTISTGPGFRRGRPGFRSVHPGIRWGHPGFPGRGFRGSGFRGGGFRGR